MTISEMRSKRLISNCMLWKNLWVPSKSGILFYFVLFYFISFYLILLYFTLFYFIYFSFNLVGLFFLFSFVNFFKAGWFSNTDRAVVLLSVLQEREVRASAWDQRGKLTSLYIYIYFYIYIYTSTQYIIMSYIILLYIKSLKY